MYRVVLNNGTKIENHRVINLPEIPIVVSSPDGVIWLEPAGVVEKISILEARHRLVKGGLTPFLIHSRAFCRDIGLDSLRSFDVLELFAFVNPTTFCLPTHLGIADALQLERPNNQLGEPLIVLDAVRELLLLLARRNLEEASKNHSVRLIARLLAISVWIWGNLVTAALFDIDEYKENIKLSENDSPESVALTTDVLHVWEQLEEWEDCVTLDPTTDFGVERSEVLTRLASTVGDDAEYRPTQEVFSSVISSAFQTRGDSDGPDLVMVEAGTGVGKTLGYIAPASLWAEKNDGTVWISTFTRNLQKQIDRELGRLFSNSKVKAEKVVIRKGRENYICLLNFEEAMKRDRAVTVEKDIIALGIIARWIQETRDGDMIGGDFPAWLNHLLGYNRMASLTDRRGECIFTACQHYQKCFVEKNQRKTLGAEIVVANHAITMREAVRGAFSSRSGREPTRFIFDEAHHLFDVADSVFSWHLTGRETQEFRRWILGAELQNRSISRLGLKGRLEDLVFNDDEAKEAIKAIIEGANKLPADDWMQRISGGCASGLVEIFLAKVYEQVKAQNSSNTLFYDSETQIKPQIEGLIEAATVLINGFEAILKPLLNLIERLKLIFQEQSCNWDKGKCYRLESLIRGLVWRSEEQVGVWCKMLEILKMDEKDQDATQSRSNQFVYLFSIERYDNKEIDVGMHRYNLDPTEPFANFVLTPSDGVALTSATLRDNSPDIISDWKLAETRMGTNHVSSVNPTRFDILSPYSYNKQTRIIIVTDVLKNNIEQVALAYRELFLASRGGALGLFTAISRLRVVYKNIAPVLDKLGLSLWAQHVDPLDNATLVDIFRGDKDSCLLGTDAVRDGIDVPGESLRLIVFDRVPWPRPNILHRFRRQKFGGAKYDDMLTRLKLKQAYGRLVRRADDKGVFIVLDSAFPSRLCQAFPSDVSVERVTLNQAKNKIQKFLQLDV